VFQYQLEDVLLEDVLIIPIVKPENELVEIGLKVFSRDAVVNPDDRSFKQAPEVFHAHRVDVPVDKCFGMADGFMPSATSSLLVALEFVGNEQFSTNADESIKERGERIGFEVLDNLGCDVAASLLEPHDDLLAGSATATLPAGLLPADVSVVSFDYPTELVLEAVAGFHCLSDLHTHVPSTLVGDSQSPLKLFSGDTFLGVAHKPDSDIPLLKGCMAAMEDGAGSGRELVATGGALPHFALFEPVGIVSSTLGTSDTVGPALGAKESLALVLGGESFLQLDDVHGSSFWNHYTASSGLCQGDKGFFKCR